MEHSARVILAVAARLLSYPEDESELNQAEMEEALREEFGLGPHYWHILESIRPIYDLPPGELKEHYVGTFDLKEKAGLYLTAHELGDSRKRGMAIVALQKLIEEAGYLFRSDELADFMPMLYELLADAEEENEHLRQLAQRLSIATERIRRNLPEESVYAPLFQLLMDAVFEQPTVEELEKLEQAREQPDMDPMPYPLLFKT